MSLLFRNSATREYLVRDPLDHYDYVVSVTIRRKMLFVQLQSLACKSHALRK